MLFQNRRELVTHWQAEKAFVGGIATVTSHIAHH